MTKHTQRGLGIGQYIGSQVYKDICNRFYQRHHIKFPDHIARGGMLKVGVTNGQGVTFVARDVLRFKSVLRMPRFAPDDRRHFCDRIAAGVTKGQGYREVGVPSLHVAVSPEVCSVHIDTFGFVAIGPNGQKYYNPEMIQHIIDELLLQDKFVGWVTKKNRSLGALLGRVHFVGPSARNRYRLAVGGRINLKEGVGWSIGIEATRSLAGETRYMGKANVFEW